jgi:hypothetical protein
MAENLPISSEQAQACLKEANTALMESETELDSAKAQLRQGTVLKFIPWRSAFCFVGLDSMIALERFAMEDILSTGSDTKVFSATDLLREVPCVLKCAVRPRGNDNERSHRPESAFHQMQREVDLLEGPLRGCCGLPEVLAFSWSTWTNLENGDVQDILVLAEGPAGQSLKLFEPELDRSDLDQLRGRLVGWGHTLTAILRRLHSRGVVHRDVKPSNIIITPEGQLILIDLGLSILESEASTVAPAGSEPYVARAAWSCNRPASFRDDFESLGYTLYALEIGIAAWEHIEFERRPKLLDSDIPSASAALQWLREVEAVEGKAFDFY